MNKKTIVVFLILLLAAISIPLTINLIKNKDNRVVRFYYPDLRRSGLKPEKRVITIKPESGNFEEKLITEYLLGPINYKLLYPVNEDLVQDIKRIQGNKEVLMIINFKPGFYLYAMQHFDEVTWLFKGIVKTLKENTKVKSLYIRENNDKVKLQIADWQLYYPIKIKR